LGILLYLYGDLTLSNNKRFEGGSSRLPGHLPGNRKVPGFDAWLGFSATVVSLGKKLHSYCLSHSAVKPGTYIAHYMIRA